MNCGECLMDKAEITELVWSEEILGFVCPECGTDYGILECADCGKPDEGTEGA